MANTRIRLKLLIEWLIYTMPLSTNSPSKPVFIFVALSCVGA